MSQFYDLNIQGSEVQLRLDLASHNVLAFDGILEVPVIASDALITEAGTYQIFYAPNGGRGEMLLSMGGVYYRHFKLQSEGKTVLDSSWYNTDGQIRRDRLFLNGAARDIYAYAAGAFGKVERDGVDGITPHIDPSTRHWMIGETDTGILARGTDGESAYQTAVNEGYQGTPSEWIASLHGLNGKSAYELWVEQPGNEGKSVSEFLASLKKSGFVSKAVTERPKTDIDTNTIYCIPNPNNTNEWTEEIYDTTLRDWIVLATHQGGLADIIARLQTIVDDNKNDFSVQDENGNVILACLGGHIKTKNFDSRNAATKEELSELEEEIRGDIPDTNTLPQVAEESGADLTVKDENGNAIVIFKNGHVKTKNFDSENINVNGIEVVDSAGSDLSFCDENGNTVLEIKGGHIKTKNFDSRKVTPAKPYIYCLGSSMTQGQSGIDNPVDDNTSGASQNCYPNRLQDLVGDNYHVVNLGVGGQKAGEILARNGLLDGIVKTQFTLKGDGTTSVLCSGLQSATVEMGVIVDSCAGEPINYQMQQGTEEARGQMSTCYIKGIQCTLSYNSSDKNLYIKRNEVVSYDLTIPVGTHITFGGNRTGSDAIYIIQVGANDLANPNMDIDNYIAKVKQGISRLDTNRWISVGVYRGDAVHQSNVNAINERLSEEFGSRFINVLDYISSLQPFYELGITPTTDNDISAERAEHGIVSDTYCIANHLTPSSFWRYSYTPNHKELNGEPLVDKVHLNYNGYYLVAKLIFNKMKQLNYI